LLNKLKLELQRAAAALVMAFQVQKNGAIFDRAVLRNFFLRERFISGAAA
jgi:hypothetical protein